jgi:hypothetical protein
MTLEKSESAPVEPEVEFQVGPSPRLSAKASRTQSLTEAEIEAAEEEALAWARRANSC